MKRTKDPDVVKTTTTKLFGVAQTLFGPAAVTMFVAIFIILSLTLDVLGKTTNAWAALKMAFSEKTSLLNTGELEVIDEWVVYIDSAETYMQAEMYRQQLVSATQKLSSKKAAGHFARNLRVARDPNNAGYWLLVADIVSLRSTEEEVEVTIKCLKKTIVGWDADDVVSPWFGNAKPYDYSLADFSNTYGRVTNVPVDHVQPTRGAESGGESGCPAPYGL